MIIELLLLNQKKLKLEILLCQNLGMSQLKLFNNLILWKSNISIQSTLLLQLLNVEMKFNKNQQVRLKRSLGKKLLPLRNLNLLKPRNKLKLPIKRLNKNLNSKNPRRLKNLKRLKKFNNNQLQQVYRKNKNQSNKKHK